MKFVVIVKGENGVQMRFEIEADAPRTALQVAAARDRELQRAAKFLQRPS